MPLKQTQNKDLTKLFSVVRWMCATSRLEISVKKSMKLQDWKYQFVVVAWTMVTG